MKWAAIACLMASCAWGQFSALPVVQVQGWTPLKLNPDAWFPLNGSVADLVGGYTASWSGTEAYTNGGPWAGVSAADIRYGSIISTGSSTIGNGLYATGTVSWSVSAWCKAGSTNGLAVVSRGITTPTGRLFLYLFNRPTQATSTPNISLRGAGTFLPLNHDDDTWRHMTVTWDSAVCRHYTNGVLQSVLASVGPLAENPANLVTIGGVAGTPFPTTQRGQVAQVLFWKRALSADEVSRLYKWRGE